MLGTRTLEIRSSPFWTSGASTDRIMLHVLLALIPTTLFSVYWWGLPGLITLTASVTACVLTEYLACRWSGRAATISDGSAAVTGLLYGLTLPPSLPLWMTVLGAVVAIGVGKALFGGLGCNCFNPALIGRAFLQAAFPAAMTHWLEPGDRWMSHLPRSTLTLPLQRPHYDGISAATPLSEWKFQQLDSDPAQLLFGSIPGSLGETSAWLILVGGAYLIVKRMMNWRIPLAILTTVTTCSWLLHALDPSRYAGPTFMLLSGGLMLGAVFMATDMVASPITHRGCILYGILIGMLVVVIRLWGGMPEGMMYAILLANATSPHIDRWIQPRAYGTRAQRQQTTTAVQSHRRSEVPSGASSRSASAAQAEAMPPQGDQSKITGSSPLAGRPAVAASRMIGVLLTVGLACSVAIVSVYVVTQPLIQRNLTTAVQQAVLEVLPEATSSQAYRLTDTGEFQPVPMHSEGLEIVYAGYNEQQQLVGIAMIGQASGYQDIVQLVFGYSFDSQAILGFRVLASRETPGLGDRVEVDENFQRNFEHLDARLTAAGDRLQNQIEFVKPGHKTQPWQIDGISGATVTSQAVASIVSDGAAFWVPRVVARKSDFDWQAYKGN